jgi:hypothetical protein|tara:strand:+ start:753 stop:1013 length:261 start_codon:yes stop_codon:yes gene_type:complete
MEWYTTMNWIKKSKRKTTDNLEGIRLRSCQLWLDATGFHPFLDPDTMKLPDLEKGFGCTYAELPKEAWDTMDRYDEVVARRSVYAT